MLETEMQLDQIESDVEHMQMAIASQQREMDLRRIEWEHSKRELEVHERNIEQAKSFLES
jgi:ActR/RegA family two-component response regulator